MGNGSKDEIDERLKTLHFQEQNLNETIPSSSTQFQWVRQDVEEYIYESCTKSGGRHKTRRRTLLKDLYNLNFVEHVKVSRNSHGQPIGSEAQILVRYLGIIARNANLLPINYESWYHMPHSNKNQALDNIKVIK
ncbi:hypothetical protein J1N35_043683 [Gossypium stocksii]|uniref:Uncharacterized protein n=1 Tax=Gossypium stocksii TaxID=47602 RepID=A0A9D3U7X0_9ROSI|nr:hypothetical protein J1N35_043683 [Gossypium stocksii]